MLEKLKPCPFCGGDVTIINAEELTINHHRSGGERVNNLQKIKQMNIEELAVFLFGGRCSRCAYFGNICNGSFFDEKSCTTGINKFLAEEAL